jgi:hypothetical protein
MEKSEKKVLVTGDTVSTNTVIEGKELEKEVKKENEDNETVEMPNSIDT